MLLHALSVWGLNHRGQQLGNGPTANVPHRTLCTETQLHPAPWGIRDIQRTTPWPSPVLEVATTRVVMEVEWDYQCRSCVPGRIDRPFRVLAVHGKHRPRTPPSHIRTDDQSTMSVCMLLLRRKEPVQLFQSGDMRLSATACRGHRAIQRAVESISEYKVSSRRMGKF